jgi:hypothetical protein
MTQDHFVYRERYITNFLIKLWKYIDDDPEKDLYVGDQYSCKGNV